MNIKLLKNLTLITYKLKYNINLYFFNLMQALTKHIGTHSGVFHADEVLACTML